MRYIKLLVFFSLWCGLFLPQTVPASVLQDVAFKTESSYTLVSLRFQEGAEAPVPIFKRFDQKVYFDLYGVQAAKIPYQYDVQDERIYRIRLGKHPDKVRIVFDILVYDSKTLTIESLQEDNVLYIVMANPEVPINMERIVHPKPVEPEPVTKPEQQLEQEQPAAPETAQEPETATQQETPAPTPKNDTSNGKNGKPVNSKERNAAGVFAFSFLPPGVNALLNKELLPGVLLGYVIAGLLVLLFIVILLWLRKRKKKNKKSAFDLAAMAHEEEEEEPKQKADFLSDLFHEETAETSAPESDIAVAEEPGEPFDSFAVEEQPPELEEVPEPEEEESDQDLVPETDRAANSAALSAEDIGPEDVDLPVTAREEPEAVAEDEAEAPAEPGEEEMDEPALQREIEASLGIFDEAKASTTTSQDKEILVKVDEEEVRRKKTEESLEESEKYYPLSVGNGWVWKYKNSLRKRMIVGRKRLEKNREVFKVRETVKIGDHKKQTIWYIFKTSKGIVEKTEQYSKKILAFPVKKNKQWEDATNMYQIVSLDETIGTYENCLKIMVSPKDIPIKRYTYFKKGIGLVMDEAKEELIKYKISD